MSQQEAVDYDEGVRRLVARVLEVPSVGLSDRFNELQVDSVRMLRILSAIEEEFDRSIDIVDLLQAETVADIAALTRENNPWSEG